MHILNKFSSLLRFFSSTPANIKVAMCKQCGHRDRRTTKELKCVESLFELVGQHRDGRMKYERIERYLHICPICNTEMSTSSRRYELH